MQEELALLLPDVVGKGVAAFFELVVAAAVFVGGGEDLGVEGDEVAVVVVVFIIIAVVIVVVAVVVVVVLVVILILSVFRQLASRVLAFTAAAVAVGVVAGAVRHHDHQTGAVDDVGAGSVLVRESVAHPLGKREDAAHGPST